jgi:hypothetical protein
MKTRLYWRAGLLSIAAAETRAKIFTTEGTEDTEN